MAAAPAAALVRAVRIVRRPVLFVDAAAAAEKLNLLEAGTTGNGARAAPLAAASGWPN